MNTPNSEIKTPTPRTDAVALKHEPGSEPQWYEMVDADFSRQLERELQQLQKEYDDCAELLENRTIELQQAKEHLRIEKTLPENLLDVHAICEQRDKAVAELQQAREELAVAQKHCWNNMVCIHHTDRERAAAIGHCPVCAENQLSQAKEELKRLKHDFANEIIIFREGSIENEMLKSQLSQWQECARELYNTSEHENNLYLQLTSSIKQ